MRNSVKKVANTNSLIEGLLIEGLLEGVLNRSL